MAKHQKQKPKKPGRGGAREGAGKPQRVFNWEEFEKLCGIQSTLPEMCAWFDCDENTLEKHVQIKYGMPFKEVFKRKRGVGKVSLRRRQFQAALDGEVAMMIFLGKQYLDQADKKEIKGSWQNPYENMSDEELERKYKELKEKENSEAKLLPAREVTEVGQSTSVEDRTNIAELAKARKA